MGNYNFSPSKSKNNILGPLKFLNTKLYTFGPCVIIYGRFGPYYEVWNKWQDWSLKVSEYTQLILGPCVLIKPNGPYYYTKSKHKHPSPPNLAHLHTQPTPQIIKPRSKSQTPPKTTHTVHHPLHTTESQTRVVLCHLPPPPGFTSSHPTLLHLSNQTHSTNKCIPTSFSPKLSPLPCFLLNLVPKLQKSPYLVPYTSTYIQEALIAPQTASICHKDFGAKSPFEWLRWIGQF